MGTGDELLADYLARVERQGAEHVDTLQVRSNLVATLIREQRYDEALPHAESLLAVRTRLNGSRRLDTMKARRNYELLLGLTGDHRAAYGEASSLHRLAAPELGPDHQLTVLTAADAERWRQAAGPDLDQAVTDRPPLAPDLTAAAPVAPSTPPVRPQLSLLEEDALEFFRQFGRFDLQWYSIRLPRTPFPPPKSDSLGFGVVAVQEPTDCGVCREGAKRPAAYQISIRAIVGMGSSASFDLCREHARAFNNLLVGDGSGLTVPEATARAIEVIGTATKNAMRQVSFAPDHCLYFDYDTDGSLLHGRTAHVVLLDSTPGATTHEFVIAEIDDQPTHAFPVPQLGPEQTRNLMSGILTGLPRGAMFRGIGPDVDLSRQVDAIKGPLGDPVSYAVDLAFVKFAVACIRPDTCQRHHLD